jgi:hypothetical protein
MPPRSTSTAAAARTTSRTRTTPAVAPRSSRSKTTTSLARTVGPAIPLAIALAYGTITGGTGAKIGAAVDATSTTPPAITSSLTTTVTTCGGNNQPACTTPSPMLQKGREVTWWFVFKFNSKVFPGCGGTDSSSCPFGGEPQKYTNSSQQYVYASSDSPTLQQGSGCAGDTTNDPIGATFDEIYHGNYHYVVWNDQFYDDPNIKGCSESCGGPWGHSKGVVAWNDMGEGVVMQVSTPSWPAAGNASFPRKSDGNSLGCVKDNDIQVSQHFFAVKLNKDDLVQVLKGLQNASVVTDPSNPQIVKNGGPADVQSIVASLGVKSASATVLTARLSSGIELISKPSQLHVPPWQMVSALLGGIPLRTATWWATPEIPSTTSAGAPACWSSTLAQPGPVDIATTGHWSGKEFGLTGGLGTNYNHAKLGVSTSTNDHYAIFGDMNQQGTLDGSNCASSQNGRGGTFYVVSNPQLATSLTSLIAGSSAPTEAASK